jgi:hypothetical protein
MKTIMARKIVISDGNREENIFWRGVADHEAQAMIDRLNQINAQTPKRSVHGADLYYRDAKVIA